MIRELRGRSEGDQGAAGVPDAYFAAEKRRKSIPRLPAWQPSGRRLDRRGGLGHGRGMRGVLFDKDGTLLDFEASWSGVYRELCLDLAEGDADARAVHARRRRLGSGRQPFPVRRRALGGQHRRHRPRLVSGASPTRRSARWWSASTQSSMRTASRCSVPVPGLVPTLAALQDAGFAMGVATSDGTAAARAALAALGIDELPAACLRLRFGAEAETCARHRPRLLRGDRRAAARDRRHRRQSARS